MDSVMKKERPSFFRDQELQVRKLIKKEAEKAGLPWGVIQRIWLWALRLDRLLERLIGIRIVQLAPWARMIKNALR
jgi:hypothetical protein